MFDSISIDMTIVISFLLVTLFVGFGKKASNIKDYALGGRNFSTGAIVATIVATWVGGGAFNANLTRTYADGLFYVLASFGQIFSLLLMGFVFIPRMSYFLGKLSIAEAMGDLYGKKVRIIIAILGIVPSIGSIAVQFKVFGGVVSYFLDFSPITGILISSIVVTLYSAFGGIRAVTFTDVLQMLTFGLAFPIIGVMIWNHIHTEGYTLLGALNEPKFNPVIFFSNISNADLLSMITLTCYFALPGMKPAIIQRVSMGSSIEQVKKAFIIAAGLVVLIKLAMQWLPFLIYHTNPHLKPNQIFGYIIDNYTYIGLKGLMVSGVFAMAMSTADSYINSSSVLFAHDIWNVLKMKKKHELLVSKLFSILLGATGIIMAIMGKDLLHIILTTNAFYMPIVTAPIMLTIMGLKTTKKSILSGMFAGFVAISIWKILDIKADGIFICLIVNTGFILGTHYFLKQPGGWRNNKIVEEGNDASGVKILCYLRNLLNSIKNFSYLEYCKAKAPINELSYIGLGAYIIVYTITSMYSIELTYNSFVHKVLLVIYQIMMVSGILLITYPVWPEKQDKLKWGSMIWPIIIFFDMVMSNILLVLVSGIDALQFATFTINLLITVILLGWRSGIFLNLIGAALVLKFYSHSDSLHSISAQIESPAFVIIYILLVVGATIIIFIKPREEKMDELQSEVGDLNYKVIHYNQKVHDQQQEIQRLGATAQKILNNVNHELRLPVGNVMNFAEMLKTNLSNYRKEDLKLLTTEVYDNSKRLSSMILNMLDLMTLDSKQLDLDIKKMNLSEIVEDRISSCRNIYLKDKDLNFKVAVEEEIFAHIDPNYLRQAIDNLIVNAITHSISGTITIRLSEAGKIAKFTIEDQGKGIAKKDIFDIFTPFKIGMNTESKAEGRGIGLALCKAVIESHHGKITVSSNGVKGAEFEFMLPLDEN